MRKEITLVIDYRFITVVLVGLVAIVGLTAFISPSTIDRIETRRIVLVDSMGNLIGEWSDAGLSLIQGQKIFMEEDSKTLLVSSDSLYFEDLSLPYQNMSAKYSIWGVVLGDINRTDVPPVRAMYSRDILVMNGYKRNIKIRSHGIDLQMNDLLAHPPGFYTSSLYAHGVGFHYSETDSCRENKWYSLLNSRTLELRDSLGNSSRIGRYPYVTQSGDERYSTAGDFEFYRNGEIYHSSVIHR